MFLLKTILIFSLVNMSMSGVANSDRKSLPEKVGMSLMETGSNAGPGIVRSLNYYLQMKITYFFEPRNYLILFCCFYKTNYDFTVSKGTRGLVLESKSSPRS